MGETISVIFTPIIGAPGQYHGTLVYTNSFGQQVYVGGTRSTWSTIPSATALQAAQSEASAQFGIGSDPLGTLITVSGTVSASANASAPTARWFDSGNPSYTLFSGPDLSDKWASITGAMTQIGNLGLPYGALYQNSNSAWCTAAFDAGASWQTIYNAQVTAGVNAPGCGVFVSTPSRPTIFVPIPSSPSGSGGTISAIPNITVAASTSGAGAVVTATIPDAQSAGNIKTVVITASQPSLLERIWGPIDDIANGDFSSAAEELEALASSIFSSASAAEPTGGGATTSISVTSAPASGGTPATIGATIDSTTPSVTIGGSNVSIITPSQGSPFAVVATTGAGAPSSNVFLVIRICRRHKFIPMSQMQV